MDSGIDVNLTEGWKLMEMLLLCFCSFKLTSMTCRESITTLPMSGICLPKKKKKLEKIKL